MIFKNIPQGYYLFGRISESIPLEQGLRHFVSQSKHSNIIVREYSITTRIKTSIPYKTNNIEIGSGSIPLQQGLRRNKFICERVLHWSKNIPLQQGLQSLYMNTKKLFEFY